LATLAYFGWRYAIKGKKSLTVDQDRIDRRQEAVKNDEKVELEAIEERKQELDNAANEQDKRTRLQRLADLANTRLGGK
jgi:hypothetical protein